MELKKTSCDVGVRFCNFRDYSVNIGNYERLRRPSGKSRVLSVSGHYHDEIWRNAPVVSQKESDGYFTISDLYRLLTEIAEVHCTPVSLSVFMKYRYEPCIRHIVKIHIHPNITMTKGLYTNKYIKISIDTQIPNTDIKIGCGLKNRFGTIADNCHWGFKPKIAQTKLRRRLWKRVSELRLHFFCGI